MPTENARGRKRPPPLTRPSAPLGEDREETHCVQAFIGLRLWHAVKTELKRERRTGRELVEWACREYLKHANPAKATELGILERATRAS